MIPMVDCQERETLVDAPYIWKSGHEGAINHIPALSIVLLLVVDHREEGCTALANSERAKLGEDVGLSDAIERTDIFDLRHDLLSHILIVIVEGQRVFDGESTTDIKAVELGTDLFQFTVELQTLAKLVPIVGSIFDSGINKEMEHLQTESLIAFDALFVEFDDIVVADTKTRGIEVELRFLLSCNTDSEVAGLSDVLLDQI